MVTRIKIDKVACYKNPASLETDKRINLIYGLNGTGKSTISDYLYNMNNLDYANCSIESNTDTEILVYNQSFIRDYFYQPDNLKCIFTLSKENREAKQKIEIADKEIKRLSTEKKLIDEEFDKEKTKLNSITLNAQDRVWEIKTKYTKEESTFEYCLENLKGKKESLFNYILATAKPETQPSKTILQLKKEVESVQGDNAQKYDLLPKISIIDKSVESNQILKKSVIGNENSVVAGLIKELGNSDWVRDGLKFVGTVDVDKNSTCPFCQERTISADLKKNIEGYFDEIYENDMEELRSLLSSYELLIQSLPSKTAYSTNTIVIERKEAFENLYNAVIQCLSNNKEEIIKKIKTPSKEIELTDSFSLITAFNDFIYELNISITEHNDKIKYKEKTLASIKTQFWANMRWDYDQTISAYHKEKNNIIKKMDKLKVDMQKNERDKSSQQDIIAEQQKKTINIKDAIDNINAGLLELGIDGFHLEKHTDVLYKIARDEQCENTFVTLSEGEKMIISFLYFRELCKGKKSVQSQTKDKILVIDDPISSLSHIFIFNIGQMIKKDFFESDKYSQIFLLTHSLYFFYEMAFLKPEKREEQQKLFRLSKNSEGSKIITMKYEEIQNDYQSYWYIIKEENGSPALIANCMRNIIEYFFGFIEKNDLNCVFQKPVLKDVKYQAFYRYINRESHSLGQNIFDMKEFNYESFKEAFRLVFETNGYEEHYKKMIK